MSERLLVLGGRGHLNLTALELPIEVGKLAARVFQKKLSLQQKDPAKYVEKQDDSRSANPISVRVEQDSFVRSHELQLAHKPEAVGEKKSDRDEECVGNHWSYKSLGFRKFSSGGGAGGSPQQPRLS
jgi:hypothetical protein